MPTVQATTNDCPNCWSWKNHWGSRQEIVSFYLSAITLNENVLNSPVKRHRVDGWMGIKKTQLYAAYKRISSPLSAHTGSKWELAKIFHAGGNYKKAGVAIFTSEKIDFKPKQ